MSGALPRRFINDATFVDVLASRAEAFGSKPVFTFLEDGEDISEAISYADLATRAHAVAAELQRRCAVGDRVLLLYPSCIDYMVAFFGCLSAGAIAVPLFPPRGVKHKHNSRLDAVIKDCGARVALTTQEQLRQMAPAIAASETLSAIDFVCSDAVAAERASLWRAPLVTPDSVAFLQYTSGSTGQPKGVMVSHGNLLSNERMIRAAMQTDENSTFVGWLPIYHDMGLIGNMLHAMWSGTESIFMAPVAFLQRPLRWLQAISRFRARISGGPNFAYDYCVDKISAEQKRELDLSSWRVAFNGAEPVRRATLERFAAAFGCCGFDRRALYPCYGMAETTLIVSGGVPTESPIYKDIDRTALAQGRVVEGEGSSSQSMVSSGRSLPEETIRIVDPATFVECGAGCVGEVWVSGPHVARGYWNREQLNADVFGAHIVDRDGEGPYLRTGDLGFVADGELFITGRCKDVIIVRGANHYPQDIELTVENCDVAVNAAGVAAFGLTGEGAEKVVVVAEVARTSLRGLDAKRLTMRIRQQVLEQHEINLADVVLIMPSTLPKTSSGKVQRSQCRTLYGAGELALVKAAASEAAAVSAA